MFRALLESAPDAMLIATPDGTIALANAQVGAMFGYARKEMIGQPAEMLLPARLRSQPGTRGSALFHLAATQRPSGSPPNLYGLRQDGSEFPIEIRLSRLDTEKGVFLSCTIRDITWRRQAEEEEGRQLADLMQSEENLRQQTRILQSILDSIGDGVLVADETGRFLFCNPAAEKILAMAPEPALTDTWTQRYGFYLPDAVTPYPKEELPLARAMRGESVDAAEMFVRHSLVPEGIWTSATARPLRDEQGTLRGGVVVFRDITAHKVGEEKLKAYAQRLQESNRELQDFASVASHDLQEPLRKVQAFGDRLKAACGPCLGEQGRDYLERMLNAIGRMRTLIDDLLTFSRVTTKAQPFLSVDLNTVVHEVLSDLEGRIQQSAGRVEVEKLPTIDADPTQMRQLLQNLIGNALKFHRVNEPPVIRVRAQVLSGAKLQHNGKGGKWCQLSVQDNGIGFDEKYLGRLFHVFQRLHGRSEYEGTGMGLAICRRIAERHGGTITATSKPGHGATFIVTLPVRQSSAAIAQETWTP
jgi:PAS domain S-box-containing protein